MPDPFERSDERERTEAEIQEMRRLQRRVGNPHLGEKSSLQRRLKRLKIGRRQRREDEEKT